MGLRVQNNLLLSKSPKKVQSTVLQIWSASVWGFKSYKKNPLFNNLENNLLNREKKN